jgi:hypothetical protein
MLAARAIGSFATLAFLLPISLSPEHAGFESETCNDSACTYRVYFAVEVPFWQGPAEPWLKSPSYDAFTQALEDSDELYRCRTLDPPDRGTVRVEAWLDRDLEARTWSARMDVTDDSVVTPLLAWPNTPVPSRDLAFVRCMKAETDRVLRQHPLDFDAPYRVVFPDHAMQSVP